MSCVATKIVAAPWAIVGSIGVIAQLPNFHRLLKKLDIDIEMHTAGKFKRTLTTLGENTKQGREKFISELEDLHVVFKDFVKENRPKIKVAQVSTGEVWQGDKAVKLWLIDEIGTSDDYLLKLASKFKLLEIEYFEKKPLTARFSTAIEAIVEKSVYKVLDIFNTLSNNNINPDIYDPWINKKIFKEEFNISIHNVLPRKKYNIIILAVAHECFKNMDLNKLKSKTFNIVYDLKGFLNKNDDINREVCAIL